MNTMQLKIKYSIISALLILVTTSARAEESKKFNFGFDRLDSILSKNAFNWNNAYANNVEKKEEQVETSKEKTPAFSAIKRFAAMSASLLVEFTSDDTFNEIEVN